MIWCTTYMQNRSLEVTERSFLCIFVFATKENVNKKLIKHMHNKDVLMNIAINIRLIFYELFYVIMSHAKVTWYVCLFLQIVVWKMKKKITINLQCKNISVFCVRFHVMSSFFYMRSQCPISPCSDMPTLLLRSYGVETFYIHGVTLSFPYFNLTSHVKAKIIF